jgi:hypothetical protein
MILKWVLYIDDKIFGLQFNIDKKEVKVIGKISYMSYIKIIIQHYFNYRREIVFKNGGNKYKVYCDFQFNGNIEKVLKKFDEDNLPYTSVTKFERLLW